MAKVSKWNIENGTPSPYGATWIPELEGYNFALFSRAASNVILQFFAMDHPGIVIREFVFDSRANRTGSVWHCFIKEEDLLDATCYAYRIDGPSSVGNAFHPKKLIMDPWARSVFFPPEFSLDHAQDSSDNLGKAMLGQLSKASILNDDPLFSDDVRPVHFNDAIVYEVHVKGFTNHSSSGVVESKRGTFEGLIEKIPYLKELGITIIELMPVQQFNPAPGNYWGYMTMNFFAVHNTYCVAQQANNQILEFKKMILAMHDAGIEVILDVVYNHTAEGNEFGPTYSFKGIDNSAYYLLTPDLQHYLNDTGTGNVMRTSYKTVRKLVLDSLRYWVEEMNVDGFRFDLATIFTRNDDGSVNLTNPPILEEISMDPVLRNVRLIAEPWDLTLYDHPGFKFPADSWGQWNGKYRDDVRSFVKSDNGMIASLMTRLHGSSDLFPEAPPYCGRPFQSVNFLTAHDGFTLYDLVAYNAKHNERNGEQNRDGADDNRSWNCGFEGDDGVSSDVMKLRIQQAKNFMTLLMISNGIPMFRMGDEFLHTQKGNNNAYNQDNEVSWLNWDRINEFSGYFRFVKSLIKFRKEQSSFLRFNFWDDAVTWRGVAGGVDFSDTSHALAFYLQRDRPEGIDIYVMINAYWEQLTFEIQDGRVGDWRRIVDTSLDSPDDFVEPDQASLLISIKYDVSPRSIVVLVR